MTPAHEADLARFVAKVDASGCCWEWQARMEPNGYGKFRLHGKTGWAHRASWELLVGPIPEGLTIDHLCRNTACVNPDHLEVVSHAVNIRRAQMRHKCSSGHPRTPSNTYTYPGTSSRRCRDCDRETDKRRKGARTCPECGETRTNLSRHIKLQHPKENLDA